MAVTAKIYANFLDHLAKKLIDLSSDTIKVMLCTSSYTPNQATHDHKDDVTNEITGTGYTAGGATLANVAVSLSTLTLKMDADDTTWASSTITARYAVIYDDTEANDALIAYVDFGADQVSSAGDFTIQWNAAGIATLTAS